MIDQAEVDRKNQVSTEFRNTHAAIYEACARRWENWREDYLVELRRLYAEHQKPEYEKKLSLKTLVDPVFFFRSMQNTENDVFGDLVTGVQFTFRRFMGIRNAASHEGAVTEEDVRYFIAFADHMKAVLLSTSSVPLAEDWPPKHVPPPPSPAVRPSFPVVSVGLPAAPGEGLPQALAFYVLCDTSYSMAEEGIDAVNLSITEMHDHLLADPVVADKVRISLISFSSDASVEMALTRPSDVATMPTFVASGLTNYGRVFSLLKSRIDAELPVLAQTNRVVRPVVFMVTDGEPNDKDWLPRLDDLVDAGNLYAPVVVILPCGFVADGLAAAFNGLKKGASPRILPTGMGKPLREVVRDAIRSVTRSIVNTATGGDDTLVLGD